ncbi:hypothetical protein LMG28138_02267 [Pararobbsia alpina]|uniref:Uncharacterized protein n=1 Tax=Pararobbsia alpina TaxID=621374 RepID=A0A6S7B4B0_9BURK|nr:hypothetical protein LMG28138_02267 [Pararobbsia alpina]
MTAERNARIWGSYGEGVLAGYTQRQLNDVAAKLNSRSR